MPSVIYRDPKIKINAVVYKDTTVRVKKLKVGTPVRRVTAGAFDISNLGGVDPAGKTAGSILAYNASTTKWSTTDFAEGSNISNVFDSAANTFTFNFKGDSYDGDLIPRTSSTGSVVTASIVTTGVSHINGTTYSTTGGTGTGFTIRATSTGGLVSFVIVTAGDGYTVGDVVSTSVDVPATIRINSILGSTGDLGSSDLNWKKLYAESVIGNLTGNVTGQTSDISNHNTGDLTEGSNLYFTNARSRGSISVTDAGGDGSLAYNNSTGRFMHPGFIKT